MTTPPAGEVYVDGIPVEAITPLAGSDLRAIRSRHRNAGLVLLVALGLLVAGVIGFVLGIVLNAQVIPERLGLSQGTQGALLGVALAGCLVVPIAGIVAARALRRRRAAREDLDDGLLYSASFDGIRSTVTRSGRLLGGEGGALGRTVTAVSRAPTAPALFAIPASPRGAVPNGAERRRLTDEEREELRDHAAATRRNWLRPGPLVVTLWWTGGLLLKALQSEPIPPMTKAQLVVVGVLVAYMHHRLHLHRVRAVALARDADDGWAFRFTEGPLNGTEYLPCSGLLWSYEGQPAPARLAGRPRRSA